MQSEADAKAHDVVHAPAPRAPYVKAMFAFLFAAVAQHAFGGVALRDQMTPPAPQPTPAPRTRTLPVCLPFSIADEMLTARLQCVDEDQTVRFLLFGNRSCGTGLAMTASYHASRAEWDALGCANDELDGGKGAEEEEEVDDWALLVSAPDSSSSFRGLYEDAFEGGHTMALLLQFDDGDECHTLHLSEFVHPVDDESRGEEQKVASGAGQCKYYKRFMRHNFQCMRKCLSDWFRNQLKKTLLADWDTRMLAADADKGEHGQEQEQEEEEDTRNLWQPPALPVALAYTSTLW